MPLPTVVTDENELPEGLADYYQQGDDGSYVLSVEGVDSHPEVQGLKSSLQKQKQDRDKLRKERDQLKEKASMIPDDVDADTLQQALENARGRGASTDEIEKIKRQYQNQVQEYEQKLSERDQKLRQTVAINGLQQALSRHGVTTAGLQKGATRLLQDQIKVQENDDGTLEPVADTDKGEVPLDDFIKSWVSSEEGQDYLPKASGSGAKGSGSGTQSKSKQIKRDSFDQMDADERMQFIRNGGQVVD